MKAADGRVAIHDMAPASEKEGEAAMRKQAFSSGAVNSRMNAYEEETERERNCKTTGMKVATC